MSGTTNYIALTAVLLFGSAALAVFVHPAFWALSGFAMAVCAFAVYAFLSQKNEETSAAEEDEENPEDDGQRFSVAIGAEKGMVTFYFNGKGRVVHILDTSGMQGMPTMGFIVARILEERPAEMLGNIINHRDVAQGTVRIIFPKETGGNVTGILGQQTCAMEERYFYFLMMNYTRAFCAASAQNGWGDIDTLRDAVALFIMTRAADVCNENIRAVIQDPGNPCSDMDRLSKASLEEQARIFASVDAAALTRLLGIIPADTAWQCMRALSPKIRLMVAEDIVVEAFPSKEEWQHALATFRTQNPIGKTLH